MRMMVVSKLMLKDKAYLSSGHFELGVLKNDH